MANEKILVVDDDTNICELLRLYLTKEGYQVTTANDGEEGLEKFNQLKPDMVLLDVMMPRMDGLEVCRRIRKLGNTPVMMLTAKGETFDKVLGLELGADDYMVKPFDTKELLATLRAITRSRTSGDSRLTFGSVTLDRSTFTLSSPSGSFRLANKEFQMCELLMANPHHVIPTERFLEKIWGCDSDAEITVVWVYVSYLRKKLAALHADIQIKAHRNAGYSLEEAP